MSISARNYAWATHRRKRTVNDPPAKDGDTELKKLSPAEKLVLLCLAEFENAELEEAWPSQTKIAHQTELDVRTVQRALDTLRQAGLIRIVRTVRSAHGWQSNVYAFDHVHPEFRQNDPQWMSTHH